MLREPTTERSCSLLTRAGVGQTVSELPGSGRQLAKIASASFGSPSCGRNRIDSAANMYRTLIRVDQLVSLMATPAKLVVFDCRFSLSEPEAGRDAYERGHLPGAVYADLNRDLSAPVQPGVTGRHPLPDPAELCARLAAWGVSSEHQVVAYDAAGGALAARLWWLLRWLGHDACAVLDGGIDAWTAAGQPLSTEPSNPVPAHFEARPQPELLADVSDVLRASELGCRLLDARGSTRFRGDEEPIDPVAGHIPGAVSLPFAENLSDGSFKEPAALRARYERALAGVSPEQTIVYCGSGVTACHDILAAEHAGLSGMRLYAGSWSEWITDSARPVAKGD